LIMNQEKIEIELRETDRDVKKLDIQMRENRSKLSAMEADIATMKKEKELYKKEMKSAKDELKSALSDFEKKEMKIGQNWMKKNGQILHQFKWKKNSTLSLRIYRWCRML
jgi:peptidoglycan hydrolase CwlO-like protein